MNEKVKTLFTHLQLADREKRYVAFTTLLEEMKQPVDWAYEVWDELIVDTTHKDAHKRSIAAQFLSYLAISDPQNRMLEDFHYVWKVTYDEKFVTARHSLQAIWRIALAGEKQQELVLSHLIDRFENGMNEKNATLIRFDIIQSMRYLFAETGDQNLKDEALRLIALEDDPKYYKKYAKVWKDV